MVLIAVKVWTPSRITCSTIQTSTAIVSSIPGSRLSLPGKLLDSGAKSAHDRPGRSDRWSAQIEKKLRLKPTHSEIKGHWKNGQNSTYFLYKNLFPWISLKFYYSKARENGCLCRVFDLAEYEFGIRISKEDAHGVSALEIEPLKSINSFRGWRNLSPNTKFHFFLSTENVGKIMFEVFQVRPILTITTYDLSMINS
jgi:hypothetical protein